MPGISSVLNIAKEALLTHQSSISVAGHNIANVDTPGYSRQVLALSTATTSPEAVGYFGNGVKADSIARQYDQFMVKRLADQNSTLKNLETLQQSLRVVETVFNEAPGLAVNDLLSKFWQSWHDLTNNPEVSASRQTVIQQAELIKDQFSIMSQEIIKTRNDISVDLQASITSVNSLTGQIADLNGQISSTETEARQQNDLRDSRDMLLKELSSLLDINYFEGNNGSYTILLNDGHTLVEQNESWNVEWSNNKLQWLSTNSEGVSISSELQSNAAMGGKVGGLLEMNNQLSEENPDNYLGRLDALANALIREVNQQHTQGVGTTSYSTILTSAEYAKNTTLLQSTVDIATAIETMAAGTISINNRDIGRIDGVPISYGQAKGKAYNAVQAINDAYAGVQAKLTTQVASDAITTGLNLNETVNFTVNGIAVSYTAPANETAAQTAANVADAINLAITDYNNNVGLTPPQQNIPPTMTLNAFVGNDLNGGALNSIILKNTLAGDESEIVIGGLEVDPSQPAYTSENKLAMTNGTYQADAANNTGEISMFSNESPITIEGGPDDRYLAHFGWASAISYASPQPAIAEVVGGTPAYNIDFDLNKINISVTITDGDSAATIAQNTVDAINLEVGNTGVEAVVGNGTNGGTLNTIVFRSNVGNILVENYNVPVGEADVLGFGNFIKKSVAAADETPDDGKLSYGFEDNGIRNALMGFDYADQISTDGKSFDIWLYNSNGSLALSQAVTVSLERAYSLQDVADSFNFAILNAINDPSVTTPWVSASVLNGQMILTPDAKHSFAFGPDNSNFLATAGINTLFTGSSISTININTEISDDLTKLAAGSVNEFGEIFAGDNSNALKITNIQGNEDIGFWGGTTDSLDGHYNSLVAEIGLYSRSVSTDLEFNIQLSDQLNQMRDATSGVSLDEEMANLIKFQHAYSASAKLVTIADEMLQTVLNTI